MYSINGRFTKKYREIIFRNQTRSAGICRMNSINSYVQRAKEHFYCKKCQVFAVSSSDHRDCNCNADTEISAATLQTQISPLLTYVKAIIA